MHDRARRTGRWWLVLGLLPFVAFLLTALWIVVTGLTDDAEPGDVIVVLGNRVLDSGEPHPRLATRLDAALSCFEAGCAPHVLVSGGRGGSGHLEGDVMRDYLVARGVPAGAVLVDNAGLTTRHTAVNAAAWMEERGWSRAIVATQYFHVPRCVLALQQAGVSDVGSVHARYVEARDLYSLARETVGWWAYLAGARA